MKKLNIKEEQIIKVLILIIAIIIWFTIKVTIQSPLFEEAKPAVKSSAEAKILAE